MIFFQDYRGYLAAPAPYNPSPPRHGKLRPVGRTQSAPLPLGHPGKILNSVLPLQPIVPSLSVLIY